MATPCHTPMQVIALWVEMSSFRDKIKLLNYIVIINLEVLVVMQVISLNPADLLGGLWLA
jgi:hypothetical protein